MVSWIWIFLQLIVFLSRLYLFTSQRKRLHVCSIYLRFYLRVPGTRLLKKQEEKNIRHVSLRNIRLLDLAALAL